MRPAEAPPAARGQEPARVFLALLPGSAQRRQLARHVAAWHWPPGASVYAQADWHLTLHFIGAVARTRLPELSAACAVPMAPFPLDWGRPTLWPQGLAVLRPLALPPALRDLHAALAGALQARRLPTDARPYEPHLTLARRAAGARPPEDVPAWDWPVRGYALMESTGRPAARYRVLQHYGDSAEAEEAPA